MTTTMTPPPDDIPGVTRRHTFADLYHEHTNYQFIKHSKRWFILSSIFMVIAIGGLVFRGLNLSIEFEGGTQWRVDMAEGRDATVGEVRDLLGPLGFDQAKVTTLQGQGNTETVRVQAEVVRDPIRTIQRSLADVGQVADTDVTFTRAETGDGGAFTFTVDEGHTITQADVEKALASTAAEDATVAVDDRTVTVTLDTIPSSPLTDVSEALAKYAGVDVAQVTIDTVGPTWGETVTRNAVKAMIIFFLLLAVYLTFRFEWKMSISAIAAVVHDILFVAGVYAVTQIEVSPATVTAFLTILGFSLYDTVVVFDKVRENQRALTATGRMTYGEMVNKSLNSVLMRSLATSLVALLPVMSLLIVGSRIMGATALEDFAAALAAGLFIGAYSSIFVAAPLLAWWKEREPQYRALAERRRRITAAAPVPAMAGAPISDAAVEDALVEDAVIDDTVTADAGSVDAAAMGYTPRGKASEGIPGPPAVGRAPIAPRPRQQRRRKRH
ncbi:MAG TPA: protein translocase subunit SecF [Acidimicrobiia bacterium]|nr:protein translocase subunit SecF [Acidimicrobiia bacterium]